MPKVKRKGISTSMVETRRDVIQAVGWQVQVRAGKWSPPTDAYETDDEFVVRVEIAGMNEDDFEITIENNYLLINGSRPDVPQRRAYQQMEIRFGKFETAVGLPDRADVDRAKASYENGFLTVTLPKILPGQIHVKDEA